MTRNKQMKNDKHVSEQALNMYLDGELAADEYSQVKAHLVTCKTCSAELQMLRELFVALEGLETNPVPASDLAPSVMARIRPRPRDFGLRWFVPALQGAAALALLAWGWMRLVGYWTVATDAWSVETVTGAWGRAVEWVIARWTMLNTLPDTVWSSLQSWITRPALSLSPGFSLPQLAAAGIILAALWLACNIVLLRRSLFNGYKTRS
jgi:anti-sigma factor RsiW